MRFKYINFKEDYIKNIENKETTLLIFNDYFLKNYYLRNREKNILEKEGTFLTLEEFQKNIFTTDKIILTEAKRPLTLYKNISTSLKEEFNINNYYDIIDIADLFFKYYKELNINLIQTIDTSLLKDWQIDKIEKFQKMKKEYDNFLNKNNFIPSDWIIDLENFNENFLKKFKKIIFIDIPYFTPIMKKIMERIDDFIEIEIIIQGNSKIYNEKELKFNKLGINKNIFLNKENIKVYQINEDIEEILNLLALLDEKEKVSYIYTPNVDGNNFSKLLPKYFYTGKLKKLEETEFYKFLKIQSDLLFSIEPKKRKGIKVEILRKALDNKIFNKIYGIDLKAKRDFFEIFNREYKYLDEIIFEKTEIFSEDRKIKIEKIFREIKKDLEKIEKFKTVDEFYNYFKEIGFENLIENIYTDFFEKFHEVIFNIKSSELLFGKNGFKEIFNKEIGKYLYILLGKYMEGIELESVDKEKTIEIKGIIRDIQESRLNFRGEAYFIDINNNFIPKIKDKHQIFTDRQLNQMGFITEEEKINILKYRFLQGILNADKNIIFYKKDSDSKIDKSSFLEEIILECGITIEENKLNKETINNIIEEYFFRKKDFNVISNNYQMKKDFSRLINEDRKITFGTYDALQLEKCQYKYFLEKVVGIYEDTEEEFGSSFALLGNIVHKIFEEIVDKTYYNIIKKRDFSIDESLLDRILSQELEKNTMKIPVYMDLYFQKIMIPTIKNGVKTFYKKIEKELSDKKINTFFSEKGRVYFSDYNEDDKTKPDIVLKGRIDLVVDCQEEKYIIDYKTGGTADGQLDIYSLMLYGDSNVAKKIIYNVIKEEMKEIEESLVTKEKLNEILNNFIEEKTYLRAEKVSECRNCSFLNICRRDVI
ncbi:MAG: PD-(D/E)XK nuclease family protein [Fusobacterium perfoetens]|uniref:PD-(D/E)XK nuclease family protein n=1 Tax=Fusobacterium perfoetens TaxID=852 RepID=UPI0023F2067D|nr:PD-(D/E)XK nuclease family protein [Fusobacterium perfoetens]MCI6153269.1 PD-(D/E)XK nuclease family protein [Fusobacterium perfoetens]MDY3238371.1 PD-(D/E)XK nuclease family protein [Fusobacterium perfoetens]